MMMQFNIRRGLMLFVAIAALSCAGAASAESRAAPPDLAVIDAVWKPHRLVFKYDGDNSFYTCRALAGKLESILLSIGAREDISFSRYACNEQIGYARFEIVFYSPVEATADNVRELTTYSGRDELIARSRGEALVSAADLPRFPAQWQKVSFARDRRMHLEPSDCELVRAVRRQILEHMSVSVTNQGIRCSPGYGNIGPPSLTVAALVAVPADRAE